MATVTNRVDDRDGSALPADTPVTVLRVDDPRFGEYDGKALQLDLSDANAEKALKALLPYLKVATEIVAPTPKPATRKNDGRTAEIRAWAIANGLKVNERGALPASAIEAFERWEKDGIRPDTAPVTGAGLEDTAQEG